MSPERRYTLSDFDYQLPPELIAQRPTARRGESRLLVVPRKSRTGKGSAETAAEESPELSLSDRSFSDLVELIPPGDLMVLNTSRVLHARFIGTRPSGAAAEVLLIRPAPDGTWVALGRPGTALRPGKRVRIAPDAYLETLEVLEDGNRIVRFVGTTADEAMQRYGKLPLPPYITREPDQADEDRYQTVFADREGSVAAPTAGLHFTPQLLGALRARGVRLGTLDLEVGPGTFKPVETEALADHVMHPERFTIPIELADAIATTRAENRSVWAVGTTAVRALEAAAERGGRVRPGEDETRLFITPGYRFKVVDRMITNFHLPRSTLLMLVCAFAGVETIQAAYHHAIAQRYRFYSYGDAMLIL